MCDQSVIIETLRTVARFYNLRQHTPPLNQGSTDPPAELWFNREDFNFRSNQLVGFLQLSSDPVHHCRGGHRALGVPSTQCCCRTDRQTDTAWPHRAQLSNSSLLGPFFSEKLDLNEFSFCTGKAVQVLFCDALFYFFKCNQERMGVYKQGFPASPENMLFQTSNHPFFVNIHFLKWYNYSLISENKGVVLDLLLAARAHM